jgi:hypothetical protein
LIAALLDLLHELHGQDIPITVGGGFGPNLKRRHLEAVGQRTLASFGSFTVLFPNEP